MHAISRWGLLLIVLGSLAVPPAGATKTSTAGTVTVTAIAVPTVVCTVVPLPFGQEELQCTAAITIGADGRSVLGLAGNVRYSGSGSASGDCSASGSGNGGPVSWPGSPGATGKTITQTIALCTATKFNGFGLQCVTVTAKVRTNPATAKSTVAGVVIETVSEDSGTKSVTNSICK